MHEWAQGGNTFPYTLGHSLSLSLFLYLPFPLPLSLGNRIRVGPGSTLSRNTFAFQFELMTNTNENFTNIPDWPPLVCLCLYRHLYTGEWAHYEATGGVYAVHQVWCGQHNRYKSTGRTQCTVQCKIRCERATDTGTDGECEHGKSLKENPGGVQEAQRGAKLC